VANDITLNPWKLDTAADNIVAPGRKLYPKKLVWTGTAIAGGSDLQLEDGNENVVFVWVASLADEGVIFDFPEGFAMDGCSLGVIDAGELYIYF
jgi:hypothetical protein